MTVGKLLRLGAVLVGFGVLPVACGSEGRGASGGTANPEARVAVPGTRTAVFAVQGMTCKGCEIWVERELRRVAGVTSAEADYESGTAWARYDPTTTDVAQLVGAIESLGYSARLLDSRG